MQIRSQYFYEKSFMTPLKVSWVPQSSIVYTLKSIVLDKQKFRNFTSNILSIKSKENNASRNKYQHQIISEENLRCSRRDDILELINKYS